MSELPRGLIDQLDAIGYGNARSAAPAASGPRADHLTLDSSGGRLHVRLARPGVAARRALALECRALRALIRTVPGVAPNPILLDPDAGWAVTLDLTTDCGPGGSLQDALLRDPDAALGAGLDALAEPMTTLAANGSRIIKAWHPDRDEEGPAEPARDEFAGLRAAWDQLAEPVKALGARPCASDDWLGSLEDAWCGTGDRRALMHGDPAPSNNWIGAHGARLVDFEYACPRHALFDLAQWSVRCPLPDAAFARLVARHRDALVGPDRPWHDAADFDRELARTQTVSAAYLLGWLPSRRLIAADQPWVGAWSGRSAFAHGAATLAAAAERAGIDAAASFGAMLHRAVCTAWPEAATGRIDFRHFADYLPAGN